MSNLATTLSKLIQLDIDAVYAYEQAIEHIDIPRVQSHLRTFQRDHERHILELSDFVLGLGEAPPERARDFKGFLIEGFTALRSLAGTEGALKAMVSIEEATNRIYREALDQDLPAAALAIVQGNYGDERQHLAYAKEALANRVWEEAA